MEKVLKDVSVSSVLTALLGLVLLLVPGLTNRIIVYGLGAVLVVYGIGRILRYVRRDDYLGMVEHDLGIGLACMIIGLFMIFYCNAVISILPFVFGLALLLGGASMIQSAFDIRRFHGNRWAVSLAAGILFLIAGMEMIRNPFSTASALTRFAGFCFLVMGIYAFIENRKVTQLRREFRGSDDIIDMDDIR